MSNEMLLKYGCNPNRETSSEKATKKILEAEGT